MKLTSQEINFIVENLDGCNDADTIINKLLGMAGLDCEILPSVAIAPIVELGGQKFILATIGTCETCKGSKPYT